MQPGARNPPVRFRRQYTPDPPGPPRPAALTREPNRPGAPSPAEPKSRRSRPGRTPLHHSPLPISCRGRRDVRFPIAPAATPWPVGGDFPAAGTRRQVPEPRPPGLGALRSHGDHPAAATGEPPRSVPVGGAADKRAGCLRVEGASSPLSPGAAAGSRLCYYSEEPRISAVAIETSCVSERHRRVAGGRRAPGGGVG